MEGQKKGFLGIQSWKEFGMMTIGTLLVGVGIYFFKYPNNFTTGGVSGLSVLLGSISPKVTSGTIMAIINIVFLILGFLVLNRGFGFKTIYCSLLLSGSVWLLERLVPMSAPLTDQKFLELTFSVLLPAIGSAILFNIDASTGGTDIIAMILKKYTSLNIGHALLYTDAIIAASSALFFGIETGLYSVLGLTLKAVVVDYVIESINMQKSFTVITTHPEEICNFITHTLKGGATLWKASGAYTGEERWVIMTALHRYQANALRHYVRETDPHGFMFISNISDIIGEGFRGM